MQRFVSTQHVRGINEIRVREELLIKLNVLFWIHNLFSSFFKRCKWEMLLSRIVACAIWQWKCKFFLIFIFFIKRSEISYHTMKISSYIHYNFDLHDEKMEKDFSPWNIFYIFYFLSSTLTCDKKKKKFYKVEKFSKKILKMNLINLFKYWEKISLNSKISIIHKKNQNT